MRSAGKNQASLGATRAGRGSLIRADRSRDPSRAWPTPARPRSGQPLIGRDRQAPDPNARRVMDGIGDGRGRAHDADLADAPGSPSGWNAVDLVEPGRVDVAHVGVGPM